MSHYISTFHTKHVDYADEIVNRYTQAPCAGLAVRITPIYQAITVVVDVVPASRPLLLVVRGDAGAIQVVVLVTQRSAATVIAVRAAGGEAIVASRCTGSTVRARVDQGASVISIITIKVTRAGCRITATATANPGSAIARTVIVSSRALADAVYALVGRALVGIVAVCVHGAPWGRRRLPQF